MKKRGQIELSFHWMYIALIGGSVLLLFLVINSGIHRNAEQQLLRESRVHVDHSLALSLYDIGNSRQISLGEFSLDVSCNQYQLEGSTAQDSTHLSLFSKNRIENSLLLSNDLIDVPFAFMQILFISSQEEQYYIYNAPSGFEDILPKWNIFNFVSDISQIENLDSTIIIFQNPSSLSLPNVNEIIWIQFNQGDYLLGEGNVVYSKKEQTVPFIGKALLVGALISDPNIYKCNMNKVTEQMKHQIKIKKEIVSVYDVDHCDYTQTIFTLDQLSKQTNDFSALYTLTQKYQDQNRLFEQLSCPVIQ